MRVKWNTLGLSGSRRNGTKCKYTRCILLFTRCNSIKGKKKDLQTVIKSKFYCISAERFRISEKIRFFQNFNFSVLTRQNAPIFWRFQNHIKIISFYINFNRNFSAIIPDIIGFQNHNINSYSGHFFNIPSVLIFRHYPQQVRQNAIFILHIAQYKRLFLFRFLCNLLFRKKFLIFFKKPLDNVPTLCYNDGAIKQERHAKPPQQIRQSNGKTKL